MNEQEKAKLILVAEDDYLVGGEVCRELRKLGYSDIINASDGQDALVKAQIHRPDLILMDINMPDMNGLEAARRIQACCNTPIIMLTAYESRELIVEASKAGAAAYLIKPPREKELERAIIIALARHADIMELKKLNEKLAGALEEIKRLQDVLPICMHCKKIRDDDGYWQQLEMYLLENGDIQFSHGICPDCMEKKYPEHPSPV